MKSIKFSENLKGKTLKQNHSIVLAILFLMHLNSMAQTTLIERVEPRKNELLIPYEKYKLANGLTVLINEDHSDPIVYVNVAYLTGSAREEEGHSGSAHFFEHLMFEGSEHVGRGEHSKFIAEAGGSENGSTSRDITTYWDLIPSNQLETVLWLESDRMGFLLDSLTSLKFENQRKVVLNERYQSIENNYLGLLPEKIDQALYPQNHPYSWLTIGYAEDINNTSLEGLKGFFKRWYGPNNATLTICGDVTSKNIIPLIEKYFGTIMPGQEVEKIKPEPVVLPETLYLSFEEKTKYSTAVFTFPTVPNRHPDEAPLDILANILGEDKSSFLYTNLVGKKKAIDLSVEHPCYELAGEFTIKVKAKSIYRLDVKLQKAFKVFEKQGVTDEDVDRYKASYEVRKYKELSSIKGKGRLLSYYQIMTGNPNYIFEDIKRYKEVTKEGVMRVYNNYIKNKHAVVLSIYPRVAEGNSADVVHFDTFTPEQRLTTNPENRYDSLIYIKPKDSFDRSVKPQVSPAVIYSEPAYWRDSLKNQLKIIGTQQSEIPVVKLRISVELGHRFENFNNEGISLLLSKMFDNATNDYTAELLEQKLAELGSTITVTSSDTYLTFSVFTLTKNLENTLKILENIMCCVRFDQTSLNKVKSDIITNYISSRVYNPSLLLKKLIYGESAIVSRPNYGSEESIRTITLNNIVDYYNANFVPSMCNVMCVSDLSKDEMLSKLAFLSKWQNKKVVHERESKVTTVQKTTVYFVNDNNAKQSRILVGCKWPEYDAIGEYYKSLISTYALSTPFNSRINLNLREHKGYCYGVSCDYESNKYDGMFTIRTNVKTEVTDSALFQILNEIKQYADKGVTNDELLFTKKYFSQVKALEYETPEQKLDFLSWIQLYNITPNVFTERPILLKNMTIDEVNEYAKKYLPYNNLTILVIGDKKLIEPNIIKMGYELVNIDYRGNIIH